MSPDHLSIVVGAMYVSRDVVERSIKALTNNALTNVVCHRHTRYGQTTHLAVAPPGLNCSRAHIALHQIAPGPALFPYDEVLKIFDADVTRCANLRSTNPDGARDNWEVADLSNPLTINEILSKGSMN
jgi:hypothetical protein